MAPVRSMKCMRRPPRRLPSVLVSLGRTISVISDCVLATARTCGLASAVLIFLTCSIFQLGLQREFPSSYNDSTSELLRRSTRFQFRQSTPITQIALVQESHYDDIGQDCR